MLNYSFSSREKVLLLFLAIILVVVAWFVLVYQRTANQTVELDRQIAETQSQIAVTSTKVKQLENMQKTVEERKASGNFAAEIPMYDNMTALMAELDRTMQAADSYTVSFNELDRDTASGNVLRGVQITFDCGSYGAAEGLVNALATGRFPCSVNSIDLTTRSSRTDSGVTASVHVVYFEKLP